MDRGITPPKANKDGITNWAEWWKKSGQKLGAEKRESVWEALDKVRFYVVREEPVRPVGYAVMAINWVYNDEFYDADSEGGRLIKVYRSRERAETECQQLNEKERDAWSFVDELASEIADEYDDDDELEEEFAMFDMQERIRYRRGLARDEKLKKGEGLFRTTTGVPFYEVIEVELEGME
jgi:hypothetical protein